MYKKIAPNEATDLRRDGATDFPDDSVEGHLNFRPVDADTRARRRYGDAVRKIWWG